MYITEYLEKLVESELGGDKSKFEELWTRIPEFAERLHSFNADSSWLHWTPKTFDGWYCVKASNEYHVYYQERGSKSDFTKFQDEREAINYAIHTLQFSNQRGAT